MLISQFNSIDQLLSTFPNENACIDYLKSLRWKNDVISPFDEFSKVYVCKKSRYRCRNTGKYFNVKTNSIFHNSKLDLQKWFIAIWLQTENPEMTSIDLAKKIGITQKSAWLMRRRIANYGASGKLNKQKRIEDIEVTVEPERMKMTDWFSQI
jgi:hypothetical protein